MYMYGVVAHFTMTSVTAFLNISHVAHPRYRVVGSGGSLGRPHSYCWTGKGHCHHWNGPLWPRRALGPVRRTRIPHANQRSSHNRHCEIGA